MQVKNKAPAPVQITAEQILRSAQEVREEEIAAPKQKIHDVEELQDIRLRKRKEFEDALRRQRMLMGLWMRYALWEASQRDFERARSVFERALEVDYRNQTIWLKYVEMEMKNKFVNHARNLWDRMVQLLPRVDQFWYKYIHMEEMLGNTAGARQIFERWMKWNPEAQAWLMYIKFEMRHQSVDRARQVYERFLIIHNEVDTYLKYAKFETKLGERQRARTVYERACEELGPEANSPLLLISFAQFEEANQEYERARRIYKYALDNVPKEKAEELYRMYTQFEKKHGDRQGIEDVIMAKRRFQYEDDLKANPHNYDSWLDYAHLEEQQSDVSRAREVYERAIAQVPPVPEKRYWRRYVYLWVNFAVFEELVAKDTDRARQVYEQALKTVPHDQFTFAKLWLLAAQFEIRQKNLDKARQLLGTALGKCPKEKLFKGYILLETQLGEMDRCRKLYQKYLETMSENCAAWVKFAEMEFGLQEMERARAIYELAITRPVLDMPEMLWKSYIDMEIKQGEHERVRELYGRLLERTNHVKVWISRAQFEASIGDYSKARAIFEEAERHFKQLGQKEERVLVLEAWRALEERMGSSESLRAINARMPIPAKRKRDVVNPADGSVVGTEEYWDYVFPEERQQGGGKYKLLEHVAALKRQKELQEKQRQETMEDA